MSGVCEISAPLTPSNVIDGSMFDNCCPDGRYSSTRAAASFGWLTPTRAGATPQARSACSSIGVRSASGAAIFAGLLRSAFGNTSLNITFCSAPYSALVADGTYMNISVTSPV